MRINTVQTIDSTYSTLQADLNLFLGSSQISLIFLLELIITTVDKAKGADKMFFTLKTRKRNKKANQVK